MFLFQLRTCTKCSKTKELSPVNWYIARPRKGHKAGWQSYCIECWKDINKQNKERIKSEKSRV